MPRAKKIPSGDFVPYAPTGVGEQVNVNHTNCTAGIDTKKRLYIKRTEAGLVAFCHNCGFGGYFIPTGGRVRAPKHIDVDPPTDGTKYTKDSFGGVRDAADMRAGWLHTYLNNRSLAVVQQVYGVVREAVGVEGNPLVYPMIDHDAHLYGYQLRWVDGRTPKTKTYLNEKPSKGGWFGGSRAEVCVIVEDPLSAVIISATMGTKVAIHCLFGTKLSSAGEEALGTYKKVLVWLDDDDAGIKASVSMTNRIRFLHDGIMVVNLTNASLAQPKTHRNIAEVLKPYV